MITEKKGSVMVSHNPVVSFALSMTSAGLKSPENIIGDGNIHRFHVSGDKPGTRNGWYVFFDGNISAGAFGSWKTGQYEKWCSKQKAEMNSRDWLEYREKIKQIKLQQEKLLRERQAAAVIKAQQIWSYSSFTVGSSYLPYKDVEAHGIKQYRLAIAVPVRNGKGQLMSLQFISPAGEKSFLAGGCIKGGFHQIGKPTSTVYIAEGYATGASLYEHTNSCVLVAFNAGNLDAVASTAKSLYPASNVVIAADNDVKTKGNPGVSAAVSAAIKHGLNIIIPPICGDWNDYLTMEVA